MTGEIFRRLSRAYLGTEESRLFPRILELCLDEDDASVLLTLPGSAEETARRMGKDRNEIVGVLERLFEEGFVSREMTDEGLRYSRVKDDLYPYILPNRAFLDKLDEEGERERFLDLWDQFFEQEGSYFSEMQCADRPQTRVIPVEKTISAKWGEVLPLESLSKVVEDACTIAVTDCACRVMSRRCGHPVDNCILLNDFAQTFIERGSAREIGKEEALEVLTRCEDEGLVHQLNNTDSEGYEFICNCCSCCCTILRGMASLGKENLSIRSRYVSSISPELCDGCGVCEARCQFGAVEVVDDRTTVNQERCFGCGLCASACHAAAISMTRARPPDHLYDGLL